MLREKKETPIRFSSLGQMVQFDTIKFCFVKHEMQFVNHGSFSNNSITFQTLYFNIIKSKEMFDAKLKRKYQKTGCN